MNILPKKNIGFSINNLRLSCPFDDFFCEWENRLLYLGKHIKECEYWKINCPKNCGEYIYEKEISKHLEEECKKLTKCEACNEEILIRDKKNNFFNICLEIKINCPNDCEELIYEKDLALHLQKCPLNRYRSKPICIN